jgi:hypothetical protein
LTARNGALTVECWDERRNLVRRIRAVRAEKRGRIDLEVEKFGARTGIISLLDLADRANAGAARHGTRLKYREQFRKSLRRQFPAWRIAELSTEPDLHRSLSPVYPRALLRKGATGIAAIGAAEDALDTDGVLSFGLIWLDYLRRRETRIHIEGLAIFVPVQAQVTTCHRVRFLDPARATYSVFVHNGGQEDLVDPGDYTNFQTRLESCPSSMPQDWADRIAQIAGVDRRDKADGSVSLSIRGLEFARIAGGRLLFGIDHKHAGGEAHLPEVAALAGELARMRSASAADRSNPLYARNPEAWLEAEVRRNIETVDASLWPNPVYGQVPQFAGGERGIVDLLAADRSGQLAVIEIKASQDIHLPLQALDYWMRVKWHLDRGEFEGRGYFPGIPLTNNAPKLLLVAPAIEWHPTNEVVLGYFHPQIQAVRLGVGIQWRQELRIMFRNSATPWQTLFYARSSRLFRT